VPQQSKVEELSITTGIHVLKDREQGTFKTQDITHGSAVSLTLHDLHVL
jgi:hypothetical protein